MVVTDPERMEHSVEGYLAPRFLDAEAEKIDRRKAASWLTSSSASGDTVWMGSADASGLVVS